MSILRSSTFSSANNIFLTLCVFLAVALIIPVLAHSLLQHSPEYDELLHVLSARGVNSVGAPAIDQGVYPRAELYTRLVAYITQGSNSQLSSELLAARLPALAFGMLLAGVIGAWVTRHAGWLAGTSAGVVFCLAPITIHLSVLVRFYTLHALVMTVFLIVLYEISLQRHRWWVRLLGVLGLVGLFLLGHHLHVLSELTAGAGVVGLIGVMIFDQKARWAPVAKRFPLISIILLAGVCLGGLYGIDQFGIIDMLRGTTPAWSEARANYYGFYLGALGFHMPFIWPVFPALVVFALIANPRVALFCLLVFITGLVANSIASQKAMRYIYHVFPMLCVLWGIGLYKLLDMFARAIRRQTHINYVTALFGVLTVFMLCFVNTHEFKRAAKLITGKGQLDEALPVMNEPNWVASKPALEGFVASNDTLVVNSGVKSLHAFGRYDYELNRNVVDETDTGEQFGVDQRTGRQVISSVDAVDQVLKQPGVTLFVLENRMLNTSNSVGSDVVELIESRCEFVPLAAVTRLSAWRCL